MSSDGRTARVAESRGSPVYHRREGPAVILPPARGVVFYSSREKDTTPGARLEAANEEGRETAPLAPDTDPRRWHGGD